MRNDPGRRNIIKKMAGIAAAAGVNYWPETILAAEKPFEPKIQMKISPPGPRSLALVKQLKQCIGRSNYTGLYGIGLRSGEHIYIEDMDGNVYIDCLTSASSCLLGYSFDELAEIYYKTASKIQHTGFGYSPNQETVELAGKLVNITPGDFPKKVLIGLSGSDSCGGAIEAVRKYTGKMGVISFHYAYHGSTGLSQAASGFRSLNENIYDPMDPNFVKVSFPTNGNEAERALKNIGTILAFGKTAAVMIETIQGDSGTLVAPAGFYPCLQEMLHNHSVLLIDDEVQSGMGRTGKWCACEHDDIIPDIVVLGKGLSAGYAPVSAIIGRAEVLDALVPAAHIFTYMGHPPSSAVASRVIDIIQSEDLMLNARRVGGKMLGRLKELESKYPDVIVEARGKGLMIGIEINISKNVHAGKIFAFRCVEKGVYFGYIGDRQKVIRVLPPLILSEDEADVIVDIVEDVTHEIHMERIPSATLEKVNHFALGW